jgi:hypothetical protein
VDEAVFDDGEAELLVELVQRLHLVHRNCHTTMHLMIQFRCRGKATQICTVLEKHELGTHASLQQVWEARTAGSSYPGARANRFDGVATTEDEDEAQPIPCSGDRWMDGRGT